MTQKHKPHTLKFSSIHDVAFLICHVIFAISELQLFFDRLAFCFIDVQEDNLSKSGDILLICPYMIARAVARTLIGALYIYITSSSGRRVPFQIKFKLFYLKICRVNHEYTNIQNSVSVLAKALMTAGEVY